MQKLSFIGLSAATVSLLILSGCNRPQPIAIAPPVNAGQPTMAPPMGGAPGNGQPAAGQNVYSWRDVPVNQQVPIIRATFDQGGYQLFAQTGETIVIPFENQNLYVMKFGRSNGDYYFVNDGQVPTLFVPNGGFLENAVAQGAKWYPFPQNFAYERPVYMGIAPSWAAYSGMGWYPGMAYYGGYWGYNPYGFMPMPGLTILIGGHSYYGWNSYHSYYISNPRGFVRNTTVYNNYRSTGRSFGGSSFGRSGGSTGSFGRSSGSTGSFGRSTGSTGSFGRSTGSTGSFGRSTGSTGSFGRSTGSTGGFGSGTSSRPSGSFGGSSSGFGGGTRSTGGSFGGRSSGFGGSFGRSGGSFGGGSSSGRSSGGGSFGGGRSFGGGGRRR